MVATNELSERELEILKLVATGASNKQVARQLYISPNTVKVHLQNIFSKIGVASRTEAAMYAVNSGLVERDNLHDIETETEVLSPDQPRSFFNQRIVLFLFFILIVIFGLFIYLIWQNDQRNQQIDEALKTKSRWRELASMPTARYGHAVAVFENQIYAIAGMGEGGIENAVERYNPTLDSWQKLSTKPTPVYEIGAALIGGKIYIPGGRVSESMVTDVLEIYDIDKDQWSKGTSLPEALCGYAIAAYEGKLYLFGGWDGTSYINDANIYDPDSGTWTTTQTMLEENAYAGAAIIDNKIDIIGGYNGKSILIDNKIFDPNIENLDNQAWSIGNNLPYGVYGASFAQIADSLYIIGGKTGDQNSDTILQYEIQSGSWRVLEETNFRLGAFQASSVISPNIYLLGGIISNQIENQNLAYQAVYIINLPLVR
jgi:DNA-binding CsgD family transcriptional regulator/N-acetylneuraminic acid mutarotase